MPAYLNRFHRLNNSPFLKKRCLREYKNNNIVRNKFKSSLYLKNMMGKKVFGYYYTRVQVGVGVAVAVRGPKISLGFAAK